MLKMYPWEKGSRVFGSVEKIGVDPRVNCGGKVRTTNTEISTVE
jgi:hypothetical protein